MQYPVSSNPWRVPGSIRQNRPHQFRIIDFSRRRIDSFEQLIHLLVAHLLAQIRQDISQLSDTNETCHVLIEDLEAAAVFFGFAGIAEATGTI
jgi:hypothetical protein